MKKLLSLFLVLVFSTFAQAQETKVGLHLFSHHFGDGGKRGYWWEPNYEFNNNNYGVYAVRDGWTGGVFYNSERRTSIYAGYTWETEQWNRLSAAVTVGAITGYRPGMRPYPMVVPSVAWNHGLLGSGSTLRVMLMPKAAKQGATALHLSHEWRF